MKRRSVLVACIAAATSAAFVGSLLASLSYPRVRRPVTIVEIFLIGCACFTATLTTKTWLICRRVWQLERRSQAEGGAGGSAGGQ
jgi:hypothetical protein